MELYETGTGINSQKCPSYLGAARVTVTAAVGGFMRWEGQKDDYSDGITGLNSSVARATATAGDVPKKSTIFQDIKGIRLYKTCRKLQGFGGFMGQWV